MSYTLEATVERLSSSGSWQQKCVQEDWYGKANNRGFFFELVASFKGARNYI